MKQNILKSIILGLCGLASLVFGCWRYGIHGLAWLPGFIVAVFCFIKILDVNKIGQADETR